MSLLIVTNNAAALAATKAYRQHQVPAAKTTQRKPAPTAGPSRIAARVRSLFTSK